MAEARFPGVHDLFEFADDRFGRAVLHRIHAHRLSLQPVDVEAANGVEGGLTFAAGAHDDQELSARIRSNGAGTRGEPFEEFRQRRSRHVLQRNDGHAVSRLDVRRTAGAVDRSDAPVVCRRDAIARGVPHHIQIVFVQRVFENEQHVFLGDRPSGRKRDRTLRPRVDHVTNPEDVAEDALGDVGNRSILEIERIAPGRGLDVRRIGGRGRWRGRRGRRPAEKGKGLGLACAAGVDGSGRLWVSRLKIGRAHDVRGVLRLVGALLEVGGVARPQREKEDRRNTIARCDAYRTKMAGHPASIHDGARRMLNGGVRTIKRYGLSRTS